MSGMQSRTSYRGDGSHADAMILAAEAGVPVVARKLTSAESSVSERPYAKGGVIEGSIPVHVMVRQLEGSDYREYWEPEIGQWVRVFTAEQTRDLGTQALAELNRTAIRSQA